MKPIHEDAAPHKILVVDDEPFDLDLLERELADRGYVIERARDGAEALDKAAAIRPDVVLLDCAMPGMSGLDVLQELRQLDSDMPIVIMTTPGRIEVGVQAMKLGAHDFVVKPCDPDHIALPIEKALEHGRLRRAIALIADERAERYQLVTGRSAAMAAMVVMAKQAAGSRATVLLRGESGVGKEVVARAIHGWSEQRDEPFVAINCAGRSRELLERELFGQERGAFTGAPRLKKGKLELAHRGTVLLDEVGDLAPELQTKLLRFLHEGTFERVGGTKPIAVDVRIIAATNRDLGGGVAPFHRLDVIPITLPPLRERRDDIPELAQFFLGRFSRETKRAFTTIADAALERLQTYAWPGNVRELANVIERAIVLGRSEPTLTVQDLPPRVAEATVAPAADATYQAAVNAYRRELIVRALGRTGGNRGAAAQLLGLNRTHFQRLLKALAID